MPLATVRPPGPPRPALRAACALLLAGALLAPARSARAQRPPAAAPAPSLPEPPLVTPDGLVVPRPDLGKLPEVDDSAPPAEPESGLPETEPGPPARDPLEGRTYLGPPTEAHVDFVPASPSAVVDPRALWDAMLSPPPTPAAQVGSRLRITAFALFGGSGASLIASLALVSAQDAGAARLGVGYALLGTSLLSAAAGGVLLTLGSRRPQRAHEGPP